MKISHVQAEIAIQGNPSFTGGQRLSLRAKRSNPPGFGDCFVVSLLAMTEQGPLASEELQNFGSSGICVPDVAK
jgi:hypothetical protein